MKGFVFIYGSEIVLRFIASGAFQDLESRHDIVYVVLRSSDLLSDSIFDSSLQIDASKVRWIPFYQERFSRWNEQFDISCILHRDKSSSFAVRYQERSRTEAERFALLEQSAQPGVYEQQRDAVEADMGVHPDILDLVLRERPDFFVLPSALLDYLTDDVLQIAHELKIPTLMLVSGWDNLSSKGLLYHQPTMMGVWGEQSKEHAVEVQNVPAERVHVIGAPHYENFRPLKNQDRADLRRSLELPTEGQIVLFAGTVRLFDETQVLKEIDAAIESGELPPLHVIYRPHPWRDARQHEDNFLDHSWRHISMDPQMTDAYHQTKAASKSLTSDNFMFRLNHLPRLYQAVDALVSPMSTVLLEALLFGLPTMAVAFNDGKHSWSADKVSRMMHFKELYEVPGLLVCRDREDLFPQLRELISRMGDEQLSDALSQSTNYFVSRGESTYSERALALTDKMLAEGTHAPAYDSVTVKAGKRFRAHQLVQQMSKRSAVVRAGLRAVRGIRRRIST